MAVLEPKLSFSSLFLALCLLSSLPLTISLGTVSISETSNQTLICALDKQSFLKCASFPSGIQIPIKSHNFSYSAIVGGNGFICALRSSSSSSVMSCWRFSANFTNISFKRIYHGRALDELEAGNSHICGRVKASKQLKCWQWREFNSISDTITQNFSAIAVGQDFFCGLNGFGNIVCVGNEAKVIGKNPGGIQNYTVIGAGFQHACAISLNGSLDCWGEMAGDKPEGQFTSLALAENRSCALRVNGTVVCWGSNNFSLPTNLQATYFIAIVAKRSVFCGIVSSNYSLMCWGNQIFDANSLVFENVKPGSCTEQCSCAPLPGFSSFCPEGLFICQPCITTQLSALSPPPAGCSKGGGWSAKMVVFLVVGITGSIALVTSTACCLLFTRSIGGSSRVHDSGRLDNAETPQESGVSHQRNDPESHLPPPPVLEKRLSHILSGGSGGHLEEYSLQFLLEVTNNFSQDHKIGSGSFGSVYRATLEDGRVVAIKRAESSSLTPSNPVVLTKRQEDTDTAFLAELKFLSRLNHKNLVRLLGFCDDSDERVLVYEYMSNSTLHEHLHKLKSSSPLSSWPRRLKVALDAARGIEYLHAYAVPPVIHRDIKSSNILLDDDWTAKVSDFGLSLISPNNEESHLSLQAAGTVGYMDPEYYRLHQLTTKSDVYSFGVVLLELLSGYKAIHLNEHGIPRNVVDFIVPYIVRDDLHRVLDTNVPPPTPIEIEAIAYVGYIAADCVSLEGRDRPSMSEVVNCLERAWASCFAPPTVSRSSTASSH
ncbi:hypothetical protein Nepgr_023624 [Nepenthes gracilis]|uniref:Protein kinase domain-containing protein n=1 Tax=Nepenthes gracilis TaxID=150966 RepID=A0AAD3T488_NEPGR|nr:hypothetical protein Nepgr_023624 [Nepenthes gracilis]